MRDPDKSLVSGVVFFSWISSFYLTHVFRALQISSIYCNKILKSLAMSPHVAVLDVNGFCTCDFNDGIFWP